MTFNYKKDNNPKTVKNIKLTQIPFLEESINNLTEQINSKYLEFMRNYEDIKTFCQILRNISINDYKEQQGKIHMKMRRAPKILEEINEIERQLISMDVRDPILKVNK